jgi:hypothetical protein
MDCQKAQENLWEYYHRQLASNLMLETKEHILTCPSCAAQFDTLKQVDVKLDCPLELNPSSDSDQKLNARLDELGKKHPGLDIRPFCREHRYALSFVLLSMVTAGVWFGFRHQQEQRLGTLEDVLKLQEKYIGKMGPSTGHMDHSRSSRQEPLPRMGTEKEAENPLTQEQTLPDEDRVVIENLDLLEDYDLLKNFGFADAQTKSPFR